MKKIPFFAVIAAFTLLFAACKKDQSPEELLTGSSCWKQVKSESRASTNDAWADDTIEACSQDDCTSFNTGGTYSFDEGATKCDAGDPQTSTGTFTLSEDGKTLTITESGLALPFTVEELTSSKLVLKLTFLGESRTTFESK